VPACLVHRGGGETHPLAKKMHTLLAHAAKLKKKLAVQERRHGGLHPGVMHVKQAIRSPGAFCPHCLACPPQRINGAADRQVSAAPRSSGA
jgi:hypothetical protein